MKKFLRHWKALVIVAVIVAMIPITIFAAGSNTNTVRYNAVNKSIQGKYVEPTREGYTFMGWATTKEKADAGEVDFTGNPEDLTNADLNKIGNGETKHVYAVWGNVKYAVQLYGIGQDTDENGKTMGLTFGPATGADYTKTYKSHTPTGNDSNGNPHRCIHNDDWKTIIEWNNKDPYVYEQCIDNDCTHSVNLTPSDSAKGVTFANDFDTYTSTGDGPGMLYNELSSKIWNDSYSDGMNYAGSRIRAMLNGHDSHTVDSLAGSDSTKYTADTCLLSAFPKELQNAIGKKAVHYATSYRAYTSDNVIYDKLWLFSNKEIYGSIPSSYGSNYGNYFNYTSEGSQYRRTADMGLVANSNWSYQNQDKLIGYYKSSASASYTGSWWLRSLCGGYNNNASYVNSNGSLGYGYVNGYGGVAPGFVLARND